MLKKITDKLYMCVCGELKFQLFESEIGFCGHDGKCMILNMTENGSTSVIAIFVTKDDGSQRYLKHHMSKLWKMPDLLDEANNLVKRVIEVQYGNETNETADNYIMLEKGKIYGIPIKNGVLRVDVSQDPNYPGIDVEYIDNDEPENCEKVRPRVLIESEKNEDTGEMGPITARVWFDPENEDSYEITECEDYV